MALGTPLNSAAGVRSEGSCGLFSNFTEANSQVQEQDEFRSPGVTAIFTEEV